MQPLNQYRLGSCDTQIDLIDIAQLYFNLTGKEAFSTFSSSLVTVLIEQPTVRVMALMLMPSTSNRRIAARFSMLSL